MSSSTVNALLIIGVLTGGVVVFMNRCEWLKWCDEDPLKDIQTLIQNTFRGTAGNSQKDRQRLADAIEGGKLTPQQYNSLPTIGNTQDSNYRSTRINTNPNAQKNAATAIKNQQDFGNPDSKVAKDTATYLNSISNRGTYFPPNTKSNLALSLHGYKMSVF